jgi:hypothetical protein
MMCTVAFAADRSTPKNADETYVAAEYNARLGLNPTGATTGKLDVERIRRVAVDPEVTRFQAFAWELLGSVEEPSQLDFLLELVPKVGDETGWFNLVNAIRKQVRTPEDEKKMLPFLRDRKLFPGLMRALVRTKDQAMLELVFSEKNAEDDILGSKVLSFVIERRNLRLTVEPKDAEGFLRAWIVRKRGDSELLLYETGLAAELGYPWSVELLGAIIERRTRFDPADAAKTIKDINPRASLYNKAIAVTAMQKITGEDFGAKGEDMTVEQLQAACAKAKAWWTKNSKETKYRLQPEKQSPTHPAPAAAPAPAQP